MIWDGARKQFFACRDRFGVKPFFYAWADDGAFVFGSELKALFQYPGLTPRMDAAGWCSTGHRPGPYQRLRRILGVKAGAGPLHDHQPGRRPQSAGTGPWKAAPHTDDYEDTVLRVQELVTGAITRQLVSDVPLCTFLSGGLDSSVITAVAAGTTSAGGCPPWDLFLRLHGQRQILHALLLPARRRPALGGADDEAFHTRHTVLTCPIPDLCALLDDAVAAKDLPGMADVDSSSSISAAGWRKRHVVALSGECADEVFGGYPWFERPEMLPRPHLPLEPGPGRPQGGLMPDCGSVWASGLLDYRYRASVAQTPRLEGGGPGKRPAAGGGLAQPQLVHDHPAGPEGPG